MRTIAFHGYKGGTGRTLTVVNVARALAYLGQRVCLVDLDLEAPGLHYKLSPDPEGEPILKPGVVDLLARFVDGEPPPPSLAPYLTPVDLPEAPGRTALLLSAGRAPTDPYWAALARVHTAGLFADPGRPGVEFLTWLREKIRTELEVDSLLLDLRSGWTDLSAWAAAISADAVVALTLESRESRAGTRAVLRGLRASARASGREVRLIPVLARLPPGLPDEAERVHRVVDYFTEPAEDLADTLLVPRIPVVHNDVALQVQERALVRLDPAAHPPTQSDYFAIVAELLEPAAIQEGLERLTERISAMLLRQPDDTERLAEAVVSVFPEPTALAAWLLVADARRVSPRKRLVVLARYAAGAPAARDPQARRELLTQLRRQARADALDGFGPRTVGSLVDLWRSTPGDPVEAAWLEAAVDLLDLVAEQGMLVFHEPTERFFDSLARRIWEAVATRTDDPNVLAAVWRRVRGGASERWTLGEAERLVARHPRSTLLLREAAWTLGEEGPAAMGAAVAAARVDSEALRALDPLLWSVLADKADVNGAFYQPSWVRTDLAPGMALHYAGSPLSPPRAELDLALRCLAVLPTASDLHQGLVVSAELVDWPRDDRKAEFLESVRQRLAPR